MNEQVNYAKIQRIQDNLEALVIGQFGTGFCTDAMLYESGIKATVAQHTSDLTESQTLIKQKGINISDKSYNTKPNDNTFDNRTGIMNAIRYAVSQGVNAIFIPSGTWYIDVHKPLYIPSNFTLYGIKGASIIKAIQSTYSISTLNDFNNYQKNSILAIGDPTNECVSYGSATMHDIYIDGLIIDGDVTGALTVFNGNTDSFNAGFGIYAGWGYNFNITNCEVKNTLGTGIMLDRNYQSVINNCKVHDCGKYGISSSSRNGISMTGINITDATQRYLYKGNTVSNCLVYNNGDIGIQFGYTPVNIVNNHIYNNVTFGIEGDAAFVTNDSDYRNLGDCIIVGNNITGNGKVGITIGNTDNQKIIVSNNIIKNHCLKAVFVSQNNGSVVNITNNIITDFTATTTETASIIYVLAKKVTIDNNQIYNCVGNYSGTTYLSGISVISDIAQISNNSIEESWLGYGIQVRCSRIFIKNNTLKGQQTSSNFITYGIYVYNTTPEIVDISGNEFRNIYRESLRFYPPSGVVRKVNISNNNFVNSSQGSVYVLDFTPTSSGATIDVLSVTNNYYNKDDVAQTMLRFLEVGSNYTVTTFMTANNYVKSTLSASGTNLHCATTPTNVKQSNDVI